MYIFLVRDYRRESVEPIDVLLVRCESFLPDVVNRAKEFASNLESFVACKRTERRMLREY